MTQMDVVISELVKLQNTAPSQAAGAARELVGVTHMISLKAHGYLDLIGN
jgi:hypothetical protein